jgi:leucyl aminopeptidase (aminopeptidase T)
MSLVRRPGKVKKVERSSGIPASSDSRWGQEIPWDLLLRGAHKFLERVSLRRGESLLLITEPPSDRRLADALFEAAWQLGARPITAMIPYRGEHNVDPPKTLAATMKAADAAITLIPYESADFYTRPFLEMLQGGTRMLGFLSGTAEKLIRYIYAHDFTVTDRICEVLESVMSQAKQIRITCPRGTDLSATIGGRPVQLNPGKVSKPGDEGYLPPGVVGQAPLEESWNGTVIFDAFAYPVGVLRAPIRVEIREGRLQKISGEAQADRWREWFESRNDPNIYWVAHYGFGINPTFKKLTGLKFLDERMYGLFDVGFGTNDLPCFMGKVRANGHTDGLLTQASVFFDGTCVFREGNFVLPEIAALIEPGAAPR